MIQPSLSKTILSSYSASNDNESIIETTTRLIAMIAVPIYCLTMAKMKVLKEMKKFSLAGTTFLNMMKTDAYAS